MTKRNIIYKIQIIVILLGLSTLSFAQISAPGRDWADATKYTKIGVQQDSIFVFFSSAAMPKKGSLKAKYSDGSNSNFQWYKYDPSKPIASRFVAYGLAETNVPESNLTDLSRGGYKVTVTRVSDLKDTTFFCWVMIDDVVITSLDIYNGCDFLEIITKTLPSALSLRNENIFPYWDIKSSSTSQLRNNTFGNEYFNNIVWNSNPDLSANSLVLTIGNPAPLHDSKYDIAIKNPFGRDLKSETDVLPAKAAKADFTLYVDKDADNTWTEGNSGEALLALKFDTKSVNADSVFWQIINDADLFKKSGDSIIWSEGYKTSDGIDIIPAKKLLPGTFPVEHIAYNVTSGCRDTMIVEVKVESSSIKPNAIPNVFTPNGAENKYFVIKDIKNNTASIKSFRVSIFSRQGALVYSYNGNPNDWIGWDGRIDGSKRDAPEGVYYYIIVAKGWDDRSYKGGPYKGFLYLFRVR